MGSSCTCATQLQAACQRGGPSEPSPLLPSPAGPGAFDFTQGDTNGTAFWRLVRNFIQKPTAEQEACHAPKPILLDVGEQGGACVWWWWCLWGGVGGWGATGRPDKGLRAALDIRLAMQALVPGCGAQWQAGPLGLPARRTAPAAHPRRPLPGPRLQARCTTPTSGCHTLWRYRCAAPAAPALPCGHARRL